MTKQPKQQNSSLQNIFSALPIVGGFSFSQLVNYPYNFLLFLIPFLVCESILIVFFWGKKNKKKQAAALVAHPELQKPKHLSVPVGKHEILDNILKFSVEKGLTKKRWVTLKEIPVYEIVGIESLGNELSVTWKGATDWFIIKKKGASFNGLPEQIRSLLDEHQKTLKATEKAAQRKTELRDLLNFSLGIVDSMFDMLRGLQFKPINWMKLDIYIDTLLDKTVFNGQTVSPLTLNFTGVAKSIESQLPENSSKEIFAVLKTVYLYFEELRPEEDIEQAHPNFKDAKAAIQVCFTLNDIWLGKIVGEKDRQKETQVLESALQNLTHGTAFKVDFEYFKEKFDKTFSDADLEAAIEDSRETFKAQLRSLGQPLEQTAATAPPTEPAAVPPEQPLPARQEIALPPEAIIPAPEPAPIPKPTEPLQPPTVELPNEPEQVIQPSAEPEPPAFEQPIEPPNAPVPVEQTEPPKLQEPVQSAEIEGASVEHAVESTLGELQSIEASSTEEPEVQVQEPVKEVLPPGEDVKPSVEMVKKKGLGRRLRKAVMGY